MNVDLTPDRALVKRAIESGRFSHQEEAAQKALALREERERRRLEILASQPAVATKTCGLVSAPSRSETM
jgi:hypothetical protein